MKIQLEFEEDDLRKMITEYFSKNGFRVKNLDELCEKFKESFPDGLRVAAETAQVAKVAPVQPWTGDLVPAKEHVEQREAVVEAPKNGIPQMSVTDLMDPTHTKGKVPSRDELLAEEKREMQRILKESKEIEGN